MQDLFSFEANSGSNLPISSLLATPAGYVKRALICFRSIRVFRGQKSNGESNGKAKH